MTLVNSVTEMVHWPRCCRKALQKVTVSKEMPSTNTVSEVARKLCDLLHCTPGPALGDLGGVMSFRPKAEGLPATFAECTGPGAWRPALRRKGSVGLLGRPGESTGGWQGRHLSLLLEGTCACLSCPEQAGSEHRGAKLKGSEEPRKQTARLPVHPHSSHQGPISITEGLISGLG